MPLRAALAAGARTLPFIGGAKDGAKRSTQLAGWAQNFLFAGTSAFLLLVANFFPHYWYFSFFALISFLYRIIRLNALGALQLGFLFGFSYFSIYKISDFFNAPVLTILTAALGTVLFALFGWAVARAKEKFGFNPLFVSLLWVLFELGLIQFGMRPFLNESEGASTILSNFFHGLSVLFGFLAVSFVIVLVNSLLVFAIEKAVSLAKARGQGVWEYESVWDLAPIPGLFAQKVYRNHAARSPPGIPCLN